MKTKKKILITLIIAAAVIICMGLIFHYSSQDGVSSDSISRSFTRKVAAVLMKDFGDFSLSFQNAVIEQLNMFIRKLAHFSVFFSMGAMIFGILSVWADRPLRNILITFAACCTYAALDEFHQIFVSGRTALVTDVLIDTIGALIGASVCFVFICAGKHLVGRFRQKDDSARPSASL